MYPELKGLIFFQVQSDATVTRQALDWTIPGDTAAIRAVREGLGVDEEAEERHPTDNEPA